MCIVDGCVMWMRRMKGKGVRGGSPIKWMDVDVIPRAVDVYVDGEDEM